MAALSDTPCARYIDCGKRSEIESICQPGGVAGRSSSVSGSSVHVWCSPRHSLVIIIAKCILGKPEMLRSRDHCGLETTFWSRSRSYSNWSWYRPRSHEVLVSVSYVLVSWSQIDIVFLKCNDF